MAQTYNKLNIEINQKVTDIITAVQDDTNSRYLDVQLFDNGTPINLTGQEVRIFLKKPDGTNIWNGGEVTSATEGRCQFLLTTQTLAVCGELETQISIWQNNEEILSTEIFKIFVTKSLRSSGSIESSNEYGSLVILFQNIYEALDLMTEMVQSFGTAGAVAQGIPATTFWQMLEAVYTVNAKALANASVSEVLNRMGLTNDSGATATTGTLMGKANTLLEDAENAKNAVRAIMGDPTYTTYYGRDQKLNLVMSNNGQWEDIINVTGYGFLSALHIDYKTNVLSTTLSDITTKIQIIVDGQVVFNWKRIQSSGMSALANVTADIFNMEYSIIDNGDETILGYAINPNYAQPFIPNSNEVVTPASVSSGETKKFYMVNELPFKQSLQIKIAGDSRFTIAADSLFSYLYHVKTS